MRKEATPEKVVQEIRRKARRQCSAEEKIRIVLEGLSEESIATLCRKDGLARNLYYGWSKEVLEAGKKRLVGDTTPEATPTEDIDLRKDNLHLKQLVAHNSSTPFPRISSRFMRIAARPCAAKLVALLFSDLGIDASHARLRVSHDNPFSESQFRTLKYRPEFPDRFGAIEHARSVRWGLFTWYNDAHHHSGLSYLTPADVHYGRAAATLEVRHRTRVAAYAAHPERFVQGPPRLEILPNAVWINRPAKSTVHDAPGSTIVTPSDPQPGVFRRSQPVIGGESIVLVNGVESLQMPNQDCLTGYS